MRRPAVLRFIVIVLALLAVVRPAPAWFDLPQDWSPEVGEDAWSSVSPADGDGIRVMLLLPYARPHGGNFKTWFERQSPAILEAYFGAVKARSAVIPKMRIKDRGGYRYGPAGTDGYTIDFENGLGGWVWAYPVGQGEAQMIAVILPGRTPHGHAVSLDGALAAGRIADYRQTIRQADFETTATPEQMATEKCELVQYQPGSYQARDCGTCSWYLKPLYSYRRRCN